jgi:hypothetical protein
VRIDLSERKRREKVAGAVAAAGPSPLLSICPLACSSVCWQLRALLHSVVSDPSRYSSLHVVQSGLELVASKHSTAAPPSQTRHRLRSSRPWQHHRCSTQVSHLLPRSSRSAAASSSTRSRLPSRVADRPRFDPRLHRSALAEAARNRVRSAPLEPSRHVPNVSCCTPAVDSSGPPRARCACRAPTLRDEERMTGTGSGNPRLAHGVERF